MEIQEPDPKRPKMSQTTTTSDDEDCDTTTATKKPRYKRRKIAIFFAYCGVGYQGMQKNPGAKTIEGDLEEALFFSGAVPEQDRGHPKRFDWARSARTDKGVSAVGQVVSGRFYIDPPGLVERLNSNLPPQIRIFGFKRVTASFNAKKFCDRRRYVYLIPVFALDPSSHPDRESVLASVGSENELVKCLECSERGRKVVGIMGKRSFESKVSVDDREDVEGESKNIVQLGIPSNDEAAIVNSEVQEEIKATSNNNNIDANNSISETIKEEAAKLSSEVDAGIINGENSISEPVKVGAAILKSEAKEESMASSDNRHDGNSISQPIKEGRCFQDNETSESTPDSRASAQNEPGVSHSEQSDKGENKLEKGSGFCYGDKERERFNRILGHYVGTHNFHNFTTRIKAEDPSAQRFIVSFDGNTIVTVEGIKFVKCEVVGQSFMLHQIRKMIGLAVAIMRNVAPESLLETALLKDVNINVPTAPEVGLYLDECFFSSYNKKWRDSHEEVSMKAYAEEAEEFKMKHVYSHIAATEHKEGVVALWLHSLNHRNYPDLCIGDNGAASDGKNGEEETMAD